MNSWGTILLGYGLVFGTIGAYALSVVARGRRVGKQLGIGAEDHDDE
ncbi:MAG: hypothetical protein P8N50_00550 [Actinomycetota bacterium]|jgi:hypothetical protein|nr:hypothetical protein [Actinomycetota bacterium]